MNSPLFSPCHEWAEKLAVLHSKKLSSADRKALDAHLVSCLSCKAVSEEYRELDERLQEALRVRRPLQVSSELLHIGNEDIVEEKDELPKRRKKVLISRHRLAFQSTLERSLSSSRRISNVVATILVIGMIISGFYLLGHTTHSTSTGAPSPAHATLPLKLTGDPSFIRVVNASPDIGSLEVFVDGQHLLSNFQFGTITPYVTLSPGPHHVQVALIGKGPGAAAISQSINVVSGGIYTAVASSTKSGGVGLQIYNDNNQVAAGKATIRIYNLSPDTVLSSVTIRNNASTNTWIYKEDSTYLTLPPGLYNFTIKTAQNKAPILFSITLIKNTITNVFAVGESNGAPKLQFVWTAVDSIPAKSTHAKK